MNENAVVCEVHDSVIKVMLEKDCGESCHNCSGKKHKHVLQVHNNPAYKVKPGDRVEIYMSPGKTILAGFLIFIVPLLLFFIFYYVGRLFSNTDSELIPAICGISGIAIGLLINFGIKVIRKKQDLPEIIKIL